MFMLKHLLAFAEPSNDQLPRLTPFDLDDPDPCFCATEAVVSNRAYAINSSVNFRIFNSQRTIQ